MAKQGGGVKNFPLPRLDKNPELAAALRKHCRLKEGEVWVDPEGRHRVGCRDAAGPAVADFMGGAKAVLAIQDPPYNLAAFAAGPADRYIAWCRRWVETTGRAMAENGSLYVWLGADQNNGFQPLPEFMLMMRETPFQSRSFITMRNQRGYGTQRNWMAVRQELLYYTKGEPDFNAAAEYTDIPRILRGYYKTVGDKITDNGERSKSENLRAGNVWVDVQQVFYRMAENVNGCYAQKPLQSGRRIIAASSAPGDLVIDFFAHSGTTLLAAELLGRKCYTLDWDPVYCEIAIRRLERCRQTGKTGWQNGNPFAAEIAADPELRELAGPGSAPADRPAALL